MRGALRIALVGPLPPPAGGMANQTRQLAGLLSEAGCSVECVRTNAPYRPSWLGHIPILRALVRLLPYLWNLWRAAGRNRVFHIMANSGWSWHLHAVPAILIGRIRRVGVVLNYRGGEAQSFLRSQSAYVLPILRRVHVLAVPSGFLRDVFGRFGIASEILPNIVDLSRFGAVRTTGADALHIIVTRNLESIYDCATAIRAFAKLRSRLPEVRMTVAGRGPELENLRALALELAVADAVTFPGSMDQASMIALYASADLMLNASRVDNMPNALLEALASGVPIVTTDVGGIPYMVEHQRTALLVPADDADAMAEAAFRVLSDPVLARHMADAGREAVEQYTWPRVQPKLFELYERVKA